MNIWLFPLVQSATLATLSTLVTLATYQYYRHIICQEPLPLFEGLQSSKGARGDFVSYFSVNKNLSHIFPWITVNGSFLALWFFYFSLLFLLSNISLFLLKLYANFRKRRPFKGKCTSKSKLEFSTGNDISFSDFFFHPENANLTV